VGLVEDGAELGEVGNFTADHLLALGEVGCFLLFDLCFERVYLFGKLVVQLGALV